MIESKRYDYFDATTEAQLVEITLTFASPLSSPKQLLNTLTLLLPFCYYLSPSPLLPLIKFKPLNILQKFFSILAPTWYLTISSLLPVTPVLHPYSTELLLGPGMHLNLSLISWPLNTLFSLPGMPSSVPVIHYMRGIMLNPRPGEAFPAVGSSIISPPLL